MKLINAATASALMLAATSAMAYPTGWGSDITINDQNHGGSNNWYNGNRDTRVDQFGQRTREDNEVEPGMDRRQAWDAEGFFQSGNDLTIVGGFDMEDGYHFYGHHYKAGDLFIDINGDAEFGDIHDVGGNHATVNNYGYDFVFDIDWQNKTYNVFSLDSESVTITAAVSQNQGSSPWQYNENLSDDTLITSGSFAFDYFSRGEIDDYFLGADHYAAGGFDLSFLGNTDFIAHWTMSCGNDNLMGAGNVDVPEPDTFALFALGLLGLGYARRQMKDNA